MRRPSWAKEPRAGAGSSRWSWALVAALVGALAAWHVTYFLAPFEDSYITFRYARNLANGLGVVYNPGERVEGCTSLGWTFALAALSKLGLPLPRTSTVLSVASGVGLLWLTARVALRTCERRSVAFLLAPALVAASGTFAYFAGTGMETCLFALLVLLAGSLAASEGRRSDVALGATLASATLVRPEGAGYAVVLFAVLAASRSTRARLPRAAPPFVVLFAGLCVFRYAYFGDLLPNTYYAKASPSTGLWLMGLSYVEEYVTFNAGFVGAAAAAYLVATDRAAEGSAAPGEEAAQGTAARFSVVAAAVSLAAALNSLGVGGDTFCFHRFLLPAIPFLAIAVAQSAERLGAGAPFHRRAVVTGAGLALVAWTALAAFVPRWSITRHGDRSVASLTRGVRSINAQYFVVGAWLNEHLPRDAVLAVNVAGIVPYLSDVTTIDMLGLTDAHIAHRKIALGHHAHGHEKYDVDYVLGRAPDVILPGLPVLARTRLRLPDLPAWYGQWAQFILGDARLLEHPMLGERYGLRVVPIGDRFLPLLVKRGSPASRSLKGAP